MKSTNTLMNNEYLCIHGRKNDDDCYRCKHEHLKLFLQSLYGINNKMHETNREVKDHHGN
jgi:murein L,D-transpeptidase YafK